MVARRLSARPSDAFKGVMRSCKCVGKEAVFGCLLWFYVLSASCLGAWLRAFVDGRRAWGRLDRVAALLC